MSIVLVAKETREGERRVAATPETVRRFRKEGLEVLVERGAGEGAHLGDPLFHEAGATLVPRGEAWGRARLILKVGPLEEDELGLPGEGSAVVGMLSPYSRPKAAATLADRGISSLAMELVPRITRAQKMDALSSQASIAGYKSVLLAANTLGRYFPLLMTAAGTVQPSRVVVMGAGVAGLQAVATAKRLGASVEVSDIRPEVKEQVESLGGKFIELPLESGAGTGGYAKELSPEALRKQQEIVADRVAAADVVITTALVPGKQAPRLVTSEMVSRMRAGSVVVDLAVEAGGNCELSEADRVVERNGVRILAPSNLPASMPLDASTLYGRNLLEVCLLLFREGKVSVDPADEIVGAMLWTHGGKVHHGPTAALLAKGITA